MANLLLLLAIICAGGSLSLYAADEVYMANRITGNVPEWASEVCSVAQRFCHKPEQLAYAAAVLTALWLLMKFMSGARA